MRPPPSWGHGVWLFPGYLLVCVWELGFNPNLNLSTQTQFPQQKERRSPSTLGPSALRVGPGRCRRGPWSPAASAPHPTSPAARRPGTASSPKGPETCWKQMAFRIQLTIGHRPFEGHFGIGQVVLPKSPGLLENCKTYTFHVDPG